MCDKLIISQSIVYNATVNQLIVDLPAGNYANNSIYCIIFGQNIPTEATINAQVVFTIGGDQTVGYPFLGYDCTPVLASQVRTKRLYSTRVNTGIGTGVFKYASRNRLPCKAGTVAESLPIPTVTPTVQSVNKKGVVVNG